MKYIFKHNLKYDVKSILAFLIILFINVLFCFKAYKAVWMFKILVCILIGRKWWKYIKNESRMKYFEPSFLCVGLYWIIILSKIFLEGEIGLSFIFLSCAVYIASMIMAAKAGSNSWTIIKKYYPDAVKKYESSKGYIDLFDNAEALEDELDEVLKMKEDAPSIVVEAIMRRKTFESIPSFHLEMIFLTVMALWGTPYV